MEALNAVRDSCLSGRIASLDKSNDAYDFGDLVLPGTYLLPYKSLQGKGDFYSLDAVVYLAKKLLGPAFRYGEYVRVAKKEGVETVNIADCKVLEAYLTGKVDACENVYPDQLPEQDVAGAGKKRPRDDMGTAGAGGSTAFVDDSDAHETLKAIVANELRLRNRNTMLSVPGRSFDAVMDILYNVGVEEMNRTKKLNANNPKSVTAPQSSGRYQRQTTTDAAMRQMGAEALGIENVGFGGGGDEQAQPLAASQEPPQPPQPQQAPQQMPMQQPPMQQPMYGQQPPPPPQQGGYSNYTY